MESAEVRERMLNGGSQRASKEERSLDKPKESIAGTDTVAR